MDRTQFTFYVSFWDALKRIKKKQDRCEAYDAIVQYALFGTEPDLEKLPDAASMAFILAKPTLDASRRKAENGSKKKQTENKPEQRGSKDEAKKSKPEANEERERERDRDRDRDRDRERMFSIKKEAKKESAARERAESVFADFAKDDPSLLEALNGFAEMRKTIKKPLTENAARLICKKLKTFPSHQWAEIVDQSTMNCWQGLFPLDEDKRDSAGRPLTAPTGVSKKAAQRNAECQEHNVISPGMMEAARKMLEEDV